MRTLLNKRITAWLIGTALAVLPILYFIYSGFSWKPIDPNEHLIQNGLAYFFLVLFSFYNYTVFVPSWFLNKQYARYITITVCCILSTAYLPYRIEQWAFFYQPAEHTAKAWFRQVFWEEMMFKKPNSERPSRPGNDFHSMDEPRDMRGDRRLDHSGGLRLSGSSHGRSLSIILPAKLAILFLLGAVSSLISILIQATNRLRQVENDQLQAELRQLKAQIQPHFLFNTLNSIYSLAIRNDPHTPDTIVQLSEFLRYIIRDANREYVILTAELNYISNYIGLQKARLRDAVQVEFLLDGNFNGLTIAPLILFSFIENAFKYGVNPEEDSQIEIHIGGNGDHLKLLVFNNKVYVNHAEESTGIGLKNTKDRLRLLYPNTHELIIEDTEKYFRVNLHLTLT